MTKSATIRKIDPVAGTMGARFRLWRENKKSSKARTSYPFPVPVMSERRAMVEPCRWVMCQIVAETKRVAHKILGSGYKYYIYLHILDRESMFPIGVLLEIESRDTWPTSRAAMYKCSAEATVLFKQVSFTGITERAATTHIKDWLDQENKESSDA